MNWGQLAQDRLSEIAKCSLETNGVSRFPFTSEHRQALAMIQDWMEKAGLVVSIDDAGTLIGHKRGQEGTSTFLLGSHQDSVRDGGKYDGIMGIALACLAVEKLQTEGFVTQFNIEVLAFADEEGVRFPTALLGPRTLAGTFDPAVLSMKDNDGILLGDALRDFGCSPDNLSNLARDPDEIIGYLEVHIEQGPVLEIENSALGVVTGICGIERNTVNFCGETGHAGTVPMGNRKDALLAASAFMSAINEEARKHNDILATVGSLHIYPNVVNAIPSRASLTLEVRSINDNAREAFASYAREIANEVADKYSTDFSFSQTYNQAAVLCDPALISRLKKSTNYTTGKAITLPSGATHDASAIADLCPMSMLFVRCENGISHTPEEFASSADMHVAVETIAEFLRSLTT